MEGNAMRRSYRHPRGQREAVVSSRLASYAWSGFGCLNVGLGLIGIVVPGLPTTVFLLIALWAFSKSSPRLHDWLYDHPRLGPPLRRWKETGAIPQRAKCLAGTVMALSFAYLAVFVATSWVLPGAVGSVMLPVALFIFSRPS